MADTGVESDSDGSAVRAHRAKRTAAVRAAQAARAAMRPTLRSPMRARAMPLRATPRFPMRPSKMRGWMPAGSTLGRTQGYRVGSSCGVTSSKGAKVRSSMPAAGFTRRAAAVGATTSSSSTPIAPRTPRSTEPVSSRSSRKESYMGRQLHFGAAQDAGQVRARLRPLRDRACGSRSGRASGLRSGCSAWRSEQRRLARLRRDRHHGEHRPRARHHHGTLHGPGYSGAVVSARRRS